jgi:formate hydrogenlyase subunit 7
MHRVLGYLLRQGVATAKQMFPNVDDGVRGLPKLTSRPCTGSACGECASACPTDAITVDVKGGPRVSLDLGACIACGLCVDICPTGTIVNNTSTKTSTSDRDSLVLSTDGALAVPKLVRPPAAFKKSIAARVVSTGCSACDLEIGAAGNPIFDMERFGVHIVASPRFADVLLVTGPVPKSMREPLLRCYEAMAEPRLVVAVGTCAISGGVHKNGSEEANGVAAVLPVNVFIPGCPPHPWSIIHGIQTVMGRSP